MTSAAMDGLKSNVGDVTTTANTATSRENSPIAKRNNYEYQYKYGAKNNGIETTGVSALPMTTTRNTAKVSGKKEK